MPAKSKVTASVKPPAPRPNSLERRAAQAALLATQQARLKEEAAERRRNAGESAPDRPAPPAGRGKKLK
jgi:hypothetical protein